MKRTVRRQTLSVALFPFLAVLICTMGSLIVLLVLFVHQASVAAKTIVAEPTSSAADAAVRQRLQERMEDAQWRRELLEQQRVEKTQELADSRARLAHLEEHIQRLQQRAQELLNRAREIDEGKKLKAGELAAAQDELSRLQAEIGRKKTELDEARRKQKSQEQWFALIPYDGPNGTRRRPIYIECTQQGIVLQPEGIVFRPEDFSGPLSAGNPLDAALRTIREYMNQTGGKGIDPYPLIVVRPSGVIAYGAARSALRNWDDEFGYELISDDKKLAFGEPDPALAGQLQRSVAVARQRQAALAAMTPKRFHDDEPLTSFDPASVPGMVPEAFSAGDRGVGSGVGGGTGNGIGRGAGGVGPAGNPVAGTRGAGGPGGAAGTSGAAGAYNAAAGGTGPFGGRPGGTGPAGAGTAGGAPGGTAGQNGASGSAGGQHSASGGAAGGGAAGGSPLRPGQSQMAGAPGMTGSSGSAGGMSGDGASGDGQNQFGQSGQAGQAGGAPSGSLQYSAGSSSQAASSQNNKAKSGKSRGNNWGLPNAAGRATAITRPIHVAVLHDRVVLVPERGADRGPQQVHTSPHLQAAEVDAFVAAVQKEMKWWGLAVSGGYWKPVLEMEVAAGAEEKFAELQTALQGSGYEIVKK